MTILDKVLCRPCIFCEIVEGSIPDKLIYKDEHIAAFHDIRPAAETHILIVPVAHIESVKSLKSTHLGLVERMHNKAIELLNENGHDPKASKLGFHIPPFNTVDHLHLHVLGGEFKTKFRRLKYETGRMWYRDLSQVREELEKKLRTEQGARL